jgi:GSH-dependent disulfide-bond oxidoreductase
MLTIYHWEPNANSGKPILAALEKGVEFESRYIDMLAFEQHAPEYLAVNPNGTVPAMIHDGVLVPESTVMMEYIDGTFAGPALRPEDPFERWRMRWWCRYFDQVVGPSISMFGWSFFVGPAMRQRDPAELKARIERIPLKERRIAWSKAIYGTFSPQEMAESGRRIAAGVSELESAQRAPLGRGAFLLHRRHRRLQHAGGPAADESPGRQRYGDAAPARVAAHDQ